MLDIGGSDKFIFIASTYSAVYSYSSIFRIGVTDASQDVWYNEADMPDSDVKSPVMEYAGFLTVGSTTTREEGGGSGTPKVYFVNSNTSGSMPKYNANWAKNVPGGSGVESGVDNDFGLTAIGTIAYGTKAGEFYINKYDGTNYDKLPVGPLDSGNAITTYPVYSYNSTLDTNVYYFGNANGKVYKVAYGFAESQSIGNYDGKFIDRDNTTYVADTPFLDIGSSVRISGLSFSGGKLFVAADNGVVYVVDSGD